MYRVDFSCKLDEYDVPVVFADKVPTDLEACQLAMAIHQTSNVPHVVEIIDDTGECIVTLTKLK